MKSSGAAAGARYQSAAWPIANHACCGGAGGVPPKMRPGWSCSASKLLSGQQLPVGSGTEPSDHTKPTQPASPSHAAQQLASVVPFRPSGYLSLRCGLLTSVSDFVLEHMSRARSGAPPMEPLKLTG